jgi:glycine oxidase
MNRPANASSIGIAGAGLLGRLLAWKLACDGHEVSVFEAGEGPGPRFETTGSTQHAAGFSAAGMLSPLAEMDNAGPEVAALGWRSIACWREITNALAARPAFAQRGSLLLAHRNDLGSAQRVLARLESSSSPTVPRAQSLAPSDLAQFEPSLQGAAHAWLLPNEAQIDTVQTMLALQAEAPGVHWHWQRPVDDVEPHRMRCADGSAPRFDWVFDVRGVGARPALPVRGVRGELMGLELPSHGLSRPVRLLHPRHRVYLVPRSADLVLLGASEIESEDRSDVSLRSAVELMTAAHSVMPSLAEARIVRMDSNLRPALPDNAPRIDVEPGRVRINGLFRHGWLLAPALVEDALAACGLQRATLEAAA